jgi:hypothetical protein
MYLIRRVAKTQPGKAREVAGYLSKITQAYEAAGRNKAMVYISGQGVPGTPDVVYADWTQERIEQTDMKTVPEAVGTNHVKMAPLLTDYYLEFYELVNPD